MRKSIGIVLSLATLLWMAACAPAAGSTTTSAQPGACVTSPAPTVAVANFQNSSAPGGITVIGVESAATARLITMLKSSNCYQVIETDSATVVPAGTDYVITGTVTRATIGTPSARMFGISVGATTAQVEIDVRAVQVATGAVAVSVRGAGDASNPNIATNRIPGGTVSFNDSAVGPLLAEAADEAVSQVLQALRARF